MNIAMIFAGGKGVRMGAGIPKQFLKVNGKPILVHSVEQFENHEMIDKIYISTLADYIGYVKQLVKKYDLEKVAAVIPGGATAQDSIYNCLKKAQGENPEDSIVLLSDGVRPCISYDTITRNIEGAKKNGNAVTCTACFETILVSQDGKTVDRVPYRKETYSAQAPQTFHLGEVIAAHEEIRKTPDGYKDMVDNCTIYKKLGKTVHMVKGNRGNIKVTTPEDVYMFRAVQEFAENEQAFGLGLSDDAAERLKNIKAPE